MRQIATPRIADATMNQANGLRSDLQPRRTARIAITPAMPPLAAHVGPAPAGSDGIGPLRDTASSPGEAYASPVTANSRLRNGVGVCVDRFSCVEITSWMNPLGAMMRNGNTNTASDTEIPSAKRIASL